MGARAAVLRGKREGAYLSRWIRNHTIMTASAAGLFGFSTRTPGMQRAITVLTAIYSLLVGSMLLLGWSASFPAIGYMSHGATPGL